MSFFGELRRRNVVKVAVAYAIVGWLLVQIAATFFPALQLPEWTVTFVAGLVILGFPLALILSWAYELTPDGVERTKSIPLSESLAKVTGRKLDFVIIGLLVLALGFVAFDQYVLEEALDAETASDESVATLPPVEVQEQREVIPNSVAVLLCDNLSRDPDDAYFAVGMHGEILNQLVKIRNLNVIARTSVLRYANAPPPISQIAGELNVEAVMVCSVRYAGDSIAVTAQLIDPETNSYLWSDAYSRDFSDLSTVFDMQADIAMNIANALEIQISPAEQESIRKQLTEFPEAYEYYIKAIYGFADSSFDADIDRAIGIDPAFAAAYAVKAYRAAVQLMWIFGTGSCSADECESLARENADKALILDSTLGIAYAARGVLHGAYRRGVQAEGAFQLAIQLSPKDAGILLEYGRFKRFQGDFEAAIRLHQQAASLDPNVYSGHHALGLSYRFARQYGDAVAAFRRSLVAVPHSIPDLVNLALVEAVRGNQAEALSVIDQVNSLAEESELPPFRLAQLADTYAQLGRHADVSRLFDELQDMDARVRLGNAVWARFYIALDEPGEALQRLEAALQTRFPGDAPTLADFAANTLGNPILDQQEFRDLLDGLWASD